MTHRIGNAFVLLGSICIIAAVSLAVWNSYESREAGISSDKIMARIRVDAGEISPRKDMLQGALYGKTKTGLPDPYNDKMTEKEIDGVNYIGYLSIPSLGLELPVASEWSYDGLKLSPCRFSGSSKTDNLTIAAHSYKYHFGKIGSLNVGDEVILTDMDNVVICYETVAKEVLEPTAVEDMTDGKYALTLFTCTYDGRNRVTIRCDLRQ